MDTEPKAPDASAEMGGEDGAKKEAEPAAQAAVEGADAVANAESPKAASSDNGVPATASGSAAESSLTPHGVTFDAATLDKTSVTPFKLLDDALADARPAQEQGRAYVHPILFDCLLACGLLIAMGGFTIGLLKIYITHSAQQSITQRNYKAAIAILKGAPFPGLFTVKGRDPQELLNQALYLEAMDKLDLNSEDQTAIHELTQIQPGSKFFDLAQEIVKDHTKPSSVQLEGAAQHQASPHDPVVEDSMPELPPEPKDGQ